MALAITKVVEFPVGNERLQIYDLTFTSVTGGRINCSLQTVRFAAYSPTKTDDHGIVYHNYSDAGTTAASGNVYVDGVTSGDTGRLLVIGT